MNAVVAAAAVGAAVGVTYVLSPLTVWFVVASVVLVAWAARGLSGRERRWVIGVLVTALALRVLAVVVLFLMREPSDQYRVSFFFDGDGAAMKLRSMWIQLFWTGGKIDPVVAGGAFSRYGWTSYVYLLAYLQYLFGPSTYGIHLVNIALFTAGAVLLYRFVRSSYGGVPAFVGLVALMLLPTWFLWSISALKESLQFFLMAVTLVAAMTALLARTWTKAISSVFISIIALFSLNTVRDGVLELAVATIAIGTAGAFVVRRRYLWIPCAVLLVLAVWVGLRSPSLQARVMDELRYAATIHMGHVNTAGHVFKTLDPRLYAGVSSGDLIPTLTQMEGVRFVIRSLASFILLPLPWDVTSRSELAFLPAQLVWYAMWLLAGAGLLAGLRRNALTTVSIATHAVIGAALVSLYNGNVGTLVRHRDMVVPFVIWVSALGAVSLWLQFFVREPKPGARSVTATEQGVRGAPSWLLATVGGSVVATATRRVIGGSLLCRLAMATVTERNHRIDAGIPHESDAAAIAHFEVVAGGSSPLSFVRRFGDATLAAWDRSAISRVITGQIAVLPLAARVRLLGVSAVVAVVVETTLSLAGGVTGGTVGWETRIAFLAAGAWSILGARSLSLAWIDVRSRGFSARDIEGRSPMAQLELN